MECARQLRHVTRTAFARPCALAAQHKRQRREHDGSINKEHAQANKATGGVRRSAPVHLAALWFVLVAACPMVELGRHRRRVQPNDSRLADRQEDTSLLLPSGEIWRPLSLLADCDGLEPPFACSLVGFHAFSAFTPCCACGVDVLRCWCQVVPTPSHVCSRHAHLGSTRGLVTPQELASALACLTCRHGCEAIPTSSPGYSMFTISYVKSSR